MEKPELYILAPLPRVQYSIFKGGHMKDFKLKIAKWLAGEDNLIVPMQPTERMRIVLMAQLSNNTPFEKAYRSMMMNSPNYTEPKNESDK